MKEFSPNKNAGYSLAFSFLLLLLIFILPFLHYHPIQILDNTHCPVYHFELAFVSISLPVLPPSFFFLVRLNNSLCLRQCNPGNSDHHPINGKRAPPLSDFPLS